MTITTGSEVKTAGGFSNEYSNTEIETEIDIVEAELYNKYSLPKRASFTVNDDYTDFYLHKDRIYDIIRVQASVDTTVDPSGYTSIGSPAGYEFTTPNNYITLTSSTITTYDNKSIRVQYIPKIINLLATNVTALNLIDPTIILDGENTSQSPQVTRLLSKIKRYRMLLAPRIIIKSAGTDTFDGFVYDSVNQSDLR